MRKFSRKTDQRRAFLKSLAANLILKEKIKTTNSRAKETRSLVERLIARAAKSNLAAKRQVLASLPLPAARKLNRELASRFAGRAGGYTRITKIGRRLSDGAEMVFVELLK